MATSVPRTSPLPPRSDLNRGLRWFASSAALGRLIDIASLVVVLRSVEQSDMGLAALCLSVGLMLEALSGLGVGGAIVALKEVRREQLSSLFWFCAGVSLPLGGVAIGSGWVLSKAYDAAVLWPLTAMSAAKFLPIGLGLVPLHSLTRDLKFKEVSVAQSVAGGLEAVTRMGLAVFGFGAWALVIASTLRGVYLLVMLATFSPFRPQLRFRWGDVAPFLRFGVRASASNLVSEAYRNLDYFVVGRLLGVEALGVYRVAFELAMTPLEAIAQPIYRSTYPVLSRARDHREMVELFLRSARYLVLLAGPIAIALFFAAEPLLVAIGGNTWLGAAPLVRVLCWAGALRVSARLFSNLFYAVNRPQLALYEAGATLLVLGTLMFGLVSIAGRDSGTLAVCYAWLLGYPLVFGVFFLLARHMLPITVAGYWRAMRRPLLALALIFVVTAAVSRTIDPSQLADPLKLAALFSAVGLTFWATLRGVLGVRFADLMA